MPRLLSLDVLDAILDQRRSFDEAFDRHPRVKNLEARDRAFAYNLVATVLRRLGQLDAAIDLCLQKPLTPQARRIRQLLRLGAAQLLFLKTPPHAAVDTSVGIAGADPRLETYKSLTNAVLHRLARDGAAILAAQDAPRLNTPTWLWDSWCAGYGADTARAIATAHLMPAPLDIAVKNDADGWAERLSAEVLPSGALRLPAGAPVMDLPGFTDGAWWVQDAAAQMPARLLLNGLRSDGFENMADVRIADIGAAPGGKTAQLAAAGAQVIALDRSGTRLGTLRANMARLKLAVEVVEADARVWRPDGFMDAVLLDAPCSATGTIRRHPDIPHLRRPDEVTKAAKVQGELLEAALEMVRPGGHVVFATCSLQPEEGPGVTKLILATHAPGLRRVGELRTLPSEGWDGFYAAHFIKS
jgi:16S rRNA (cytosine967-C5)-methyltransferase